MLCHLGKFGAEKMCPCTPTTKNVPVHLWHPSCQIRIDQPLGSTITETFLSNLIPIAVLHFVIHRLRQKDVKEHTAISLEAEHKEGKVQYLLGSSTIL